MSKLIDLFSGTTAKVVAILALIATLGGLLGAAYLTLKAHWETQQLVKTQGEKLEQAAQQIGALKESSAARLAEQRTLAATLATIKEQAAATNAQLAATTRQARELELRNGRKAELLLDIYNKNAACEREHLGEAGRCQVGQWYEEVR